MVVLLELWMKLLKEEQMPVHALAATVNTELM